MAREIRKDYIETLCDSLDMSGVKSTIGQVYRRVSDNTRSMDIRLGQVYRRVCDNTRSVDIRLFTNRFRNLINNFNRLDSVENGTKQVENVCLVDRFSTRKKIVGTLYITSTHVIFVDAEGHKETWISHMHIGSVEKRTATANGRPLQIRCKNFQNATFVIPCERDCQDVSSSLLTLSQPENLEDLYAFHFAPSDSSSRPSGWDFFDLQSEYLRMGVPNENWVLSTINKDYELCDTYPRFLYIPVTASTPIVLGSARFRSRGRLPVLSYLHRENQAAICRCSQPLSGFSARCEEDESLLQAIRKANPSSKYMYVVDTRPKINAIANRATGKGYEKETFYSHIKFKFLGIENIHVMRSSLQKLIEVCELQNPTMSTFLSGLEGSGWLRHIRAIVDTSAFIARMIQEGVSVMVHCSDGWDRTAQTCSLASLMLDPYYRTIEGFQTLIEKDWLSFGHKYTERCGHISGVDAKESSPIFTQFVDCVWQLTQQFPMSFQFNERYLLTIHDHVFSCQFGTFIGCCEKDRVDLRLRDRTYSLWGYTSKYTSNFTNPFYTKNMEISQPTILPTVNPQSFKFWRAMYCRFESGIHPKESITDVVCAMKDQIESLDDHRKLIEKRIAVLSKLLGYSVGEDSLMEAIQNLSSSESMDFRSLLLDDVSKDNADDVVKSSTAPSSGDNTGNRLENDTECGFNNGNVTLASRSLEEGDCVVSSGVTDLEGDRLGSIQVDQLLTELQSVATEWKSLRSAVVCSCALPFEQHSKKHHCWCCGSVYCTRCIDLCVRLPGHDSSRPSPVCKSCCEWLKNTPVPSVDDFQKLQEHA